MKGKVKKWSAVMSVGLKLCECTAVKSYQTVMMQSQGCFRHMLWHAVKVKCTLWQELTFRELIGKAPYVMHGDVNFCQYSFKDVQMSCRRHADSFCCTGACHTRLCYLSHPQNTNPITIHWIHVLFIIINNSPFPSIFYAIFYENVFLNFAQYYN